MCKEFEKKIFLTSTDTTIGFISKSKEALDAAKSRELNKKYIEAVCNLKDIKKRVPKNFKNIVRRSKKTTFILSKDYSFRVVKNKTHLLLLERLGDAYTTSANKSGFEYDFNFAYQKADIIVYPLKTGAPSKIFKLGKNKIKKIR
jgi:tRNA A37 threonylcarbamoyladenosine synthetase subunit TsaC/SUA5/YrdC